MTTVPATRKVKRTKIKKKGNTSLPLEQQRGLPRITRPQMNLLTPWSKRIGISIMYTLYRHGPQTNEDICRNLHCGITYEQVRDEMRRCEENSILKEFIQKKHQNGSHGLMTYEFSPLIRKMLGVLTDAQFLEYFKIIANKTYDHRKLSKSRTKLIEAYSNKIDSLSERTKCIQDEIQEMVREVLDQNAKRQLKK